MFECRDENWSWTLQGLHAREKIVTCAVYSRVNRDG
jgi:hypothetical protein